MNYQKVVPFVFFFILSGCASLDRFDASPSESVNNVSLGRVQKEIKVGMSGAEIVTVLGSPNIVTRDADKNEVWIYDKISTNFAFSNSGGKLAISLFGSTDNYLYTASPSVEKSAGAASTSQKTLTIIIKMDSNGSVKDFTYHASSF